MSRTSTKRQENKKRQAEETGLNVPIEFYLTRKNILNIYKFIILKRELKLCREEHIQFQVCAYKGEVICS